jgi:hypothetical protein
MNRVDRIAGVRLVTDRPTVALPPVSPPIDVAINDDDFVPKGLRAWAGRTADGFHVQGLVDAEGQTFVTCYLNGVCETLEIPVDKALDAYLHPFAYGFTLPL